MNSTMTDGKRCAIFGASGGIGTALVGQLAARDDVAEVHAVARSDLAASAKITPHRFDLLDESAIAAACAAISGPLDLVVIATGRLVRDTGEGPEKSWRALDAAAMAEMFAINAIGPALIGKHCAGLLRREGRPVFAAISARVGSIADNRLGGWHSYRASKAALNMVVRNFAIELSRTNASAVAIALHPGTVDTALSRPFQRGVSADRLLSPTRSAAHLLDVIDRLDVGDSGKFIAWDGTELPF